jgi:predicted hotdog family 3-hydroxylacyl-ACP dehydratase
MTTISLSPVEIMTGVGALGLLLWVWRVGARRAKAAAEAARSGARLVSLAGRVAFTAGLIVAAQWVVITYSGNGWLTLAMLGVPALFAAYPLTRALTVTTHDVPRRRVGGRR